jgi:septation ring formation regulator EzrA
MPPADVRIKELRRIITENLRIQQRGVESARYIDTGGAFELAKTRQNHAIFARRGSGKTLLLKQSAKDLPKEIKAIYLNCEDFKHHTFPNLIIEIIDKVFAGLEGEVRWAFLGKKKSAKKKIKQVRHDLEQLRAAPDDLTSEITTSSTEKSNSTAGVSARVGTEEVGLQGALNELSEQVSTTQKTFASRAHKLSDLQRKLPQLKDVINSFFDAFPKLDSIFFANR